MMTDDIRCGSFNVNQSPLSVANASSDAENIGLNHCAHQTRLNPFGTNFLPLVIQSRTFTHVVMNNPTRSVWMVNYTARIRGK